MGDLVQREHPQNWNRGWGQEHIKRAVGSKRWKIGPRLLLRTNRKSHARFRLVPNSSTLDDLERRKRPSFRNRKVLRCPSEQESCAIAKTTARCALYIAALKIFESPWLRPRPLVSEIFSGLLLGLSLRMFRPNLKFIALSVPEIIGSTV